MRRPVLIFAAAIGLSAGPGVASAGVYTDDLTKCLVSAASPADQTDLMVWIFSAMSLDPAVQHYSTMTAEQRTEASRTAALLMQRLVAKDCRSQTVAALKYEGPSALPAAFEVLGAVGMRGLMSDPQVAKGLAEMDQFFDRELFNGLAKEAGLPETGTPPSAN